MKKIYLIIIYTIIFSIFIFTYSYAAWGEPKLVSTLNDAFEKIEEWLLKLSTPAAAVAVGTGVFMKKFSFGDEERMRMGKKNQATREEAETILAKMNEMVRGRNFAKVVMDKQFDQLNEKIHELGWLALVKEQKAKRTPKGLEVFVQLKLVDPDSEETKALP